MTDTNTEAALAPCPLPYAPLQEPCQMTSDSTHTEALLPCPFCGSCAQVVRKPQFSSVVVECDVCLLDQQTEAEATAAWNRRTTPTPATDEREAVAQWCSGCHEVRSVDCYRAGCPKSDTERRAAEILAAEARGYANAEREIASWLYDGDTCECCGCMSIAASEVERGKHRKAGK